ncbi:MAG: permease-like cell division protein FtsX [Nitrosomonas sp.]
MIRIWLAQHWFVLVSTLKRLVAAPITTLLSVVIMGITLSVPVSIYVLVENLRLVMNEKNHPQMTLFLKHDIKQENIDKIRQDLQEHPQILGSEFIAKDIALQQLLENSELPNTVKNLPRNPLPDAFVITVRDDSMNNLRELQETFKSWPAIEFVQFDSEWIERLKALLQLGWSIVLMIVAISSIAIIAVMFNTIRLQIVTKRDEIEISKLIGATDPFIRRPFLYFGALQGLTAGVIAWSIVFLLIHLINEQLIVFLHFYEIDFFLEPLSTENGLSLLFFSTVLGWLGARLSVSNHLWQIEP